MSTNVPVRWRSRCGQYSVWLRKQCLTDMLRTARNHAPKEIGSSLFGTYSSDGRRALVFGSTPVPPDSRGTQTSFLRGIVGLVDFFRDLFARSRGRRHYVGEWHSHPDAPPQPSSIDWAGQRELARDPAMQCSECILIILGGNLSQKPQIAVYVYSRDKGRIVLEPH